MPVYFKVTLTGEVIVVAIDMCSSSDIIEELTLKGDLQRLQDFLTAFKRFLMQAQHSVKFDAYKFTGDGWILLFPAETSGPALLKLLRDICVFFKREFRKTIYKYLDTPPRITGLTFGLERGLLGQMKMFGRAEYVGRAINIACRLQNAVADKDDSPGYKALVSNAVYHQYLAPHTKAYKVVQAKRSLRNIRGGVDFRCRKIDLLSSGSA
jgi:class 3 adenylate cyclase